MQELIGIWERRVERYREEYDKNFENGNFKKAFEYCHKSQELLDCIIQLRERI